MNSNTHNQNKELVLAQISFDHIDQSIRTFLKMEEERPQALLAEAASSYQRLLIIYAAIKPLLTTLSVLPLIPAAWRAALTLFTQTLDAIAAASTSATDPDFKAGKDLQSGQQQK